MDNQTGGKCVLMARELSKDYGNSMALDRLNLDLPKGQIIGLLGPNGSGKTTFLKLAAGLLVPTSGEIYIDGEEPGPYTKSVVSYLPERPYFQSGMKVGGCLDLFSDMYGDFDREKAEKMLSDLGIDLSRALRTLSKGTKEKVQLVLVMARRAKLYLLDEPIGGVDPAAREYILQTILSRRDPESTILISTHLIADIEGVLDSFLFIHRGKVVFSGMTEKVKKESGKTLDELFREVFRCSQNS